MPCPHVKEIMSRNNFIGRTNIAIGYVYARVHEGRSLTLLSRKRKNGKQTTQISCEVDQLANQAQPDYFYLAKSEKQFEKLDCELIHFYQVEALISCRRL